MSERLPIEGTHNFRDVGGYPAGSGRTRHGQLYRSDALSGLTPAGAAALARLGIGLVVDLRSDLEARQDQSADPLPGVPRLRVPIHGGSRSSLLDETLPSLEALYRQVLCDSGTQLATAVDAIAGSGPTPVLVTCTAGKDRTGLVVALALEAAGVDRRAVVADYTHSALNLDGDWMDQTMTLMVSNGVPVSPRLFEVLGGSPDHAMERILAWLEASHGSVAGYLTAHGMPAGSVVALRAKLVAG
jgi:protein-tyrosine phosphatase